MTKDSNGLIFFVLFLLSVIAFLGWGLVVHEIFMWLFWLWLPPFIESIIRVVLFIVLVIGGGMLILYLPILIMDILYGDSSDSLHSTKKKGKE